MHSVQHTNLALLTTAELVEQLEAMAPGARALPPLVLLHGGPGERGIDNSLRPLAAPPLPRLRDVVIYDQRGAGYSEPALCPDYGRRRFEALAAERSGRPGASPGFGRPTWRSSGCCG